MADVDALLDALVRGDRVGGVCAVVAHPDDEIAFAGLLLADRGDEVHLVHLTDGAPADLWFARQAGCETRDAYAALRARELDEALAMMGLGSARRTSLGSRDQEAALELVALTRAVAALIEAERPALVLTHAYEGGHPDHDSAAFVSRAALALLGPATPRPVVVEMSGYRAGPNGELVVEPLPRPTDVRARVRYASPAERDRKLAALDRFRSQREVLQRVATPDRERVRPAGREDFSAPPHDGSLHYEAHGWALDGPAFRALVARAAAELGVERVLP